MVSNRLRLLVLCFALRVLCLTLVFLGAFLLRLGLLLVLFEISLETRYLFPQLRELTTIIVNYCGGLWRLLDHSRLLKPDDLRLLRDLLDDLGFGNGCWQHDSGHFLPRSRSQLDNVVLDGLSTDLCKLVVVVVVHQIWLEGDAIDDSRCETRGKYHCLEKCHSHFSTLIF